MWKSLFLVAISGAQVSRVSAKAIADGYTQMGQPFRFNKNFVASAPAFEESSSEVWWPATGRPPLRKAQRALSHSWVCDPDHLLSPEEQAFVETRLLKLRDTAQSKCNDADNYYQTHIFVRRWGVGNKGCHDGIVLAFVKNLKTVSLATRGLSWSATILLTLGGVYLASVLGIYYSLNTFMLKSYTVEQ
ncbi:uncharacterized protein EMH_0010490 [Eimeria mitis]|uniref:Uncharacterized protein n=1 Tax=Eimeria mitis TaxID=44415 RepID=U6K2I0_9EIME|nr:uncharacterized protein EMH_0010490 [Eimeria mitis]CDJ31864.1 hypothetical protein, conserved [Eimeria mitis]